MAIKREEKAVSPGQRHGFAVGHTRPGKPNAPVIRQREAAICLCQLEMRACGSACSAQRARAQQRLACQRSMAGPAAEQCGSCQAH